MGRLFVSARLSGSRVTVPTRTEMAADAITPLTPAHAAEVLATHQAGIDECNATFETAVPTREAFDAAKLAEHRFVASNRPSAGCWAYRPGRAPAGGLPRDRHP